MARQQIALALGLLGIAGCADDIPSEGYFDGPQGAAVLLPEDGGPFEAPVGFVANTRRGTIVPLDLIHAVFLSDAPGSPFLMPRQVATGDERTLGDLVVWAPGDSAVSLFAADHANQVLIEAPYITGMESTGEVVAPVVVVPSSSDPIFVDADDSGDLPTLTDIALRQSWTTTEDWSVEYNGERWWVFGTRSGKQSQEPLEGEPYCTDRRELCFTLSGQATSGDRFELSTDNGLVEHDLGGDVLALALLPGSGLLAAAVWDGATDASALVIWDMAAAAERGRVALPEGAQAWRLAVDPDTGEIFVGDAHLPAFYRVVLDEADPSLSALTAVETAAPVAALAWSLAGDAGRLAVGLAELDRVDLFDLATDTWLDPNPLDAETAGVPLYSPVVGLASTPAAIELQEETAWGARYEAPTVAVSTADGSLRMIDAETGCLVAVEEGPTLSVPSDGDVVVWTDYGASSNPIFLADEATAWEVQVNPCAGVAKDENWTVTYDGTTGTWEVEGTRQGIQQNRAIAEQRYLSDHGEIAFTIQSGSLPETDGDTFSFTVDEGTLRLEGTVNANGDVSAFEMPAAPVIFPYDGGPSGGGWDVLNRITYVLMPVTNSDKVVRVRMSNWKIEVVWN